MLCIKTPVPHYVCFVRDMCTCSLHVLGCGFCFSSALCCQREKICVCEDRSSRKDERDTRKQGEKRNGCSSGEWMVFNKLVWTFFPGCRQAQFTHDAKAPKSFDVACELCVNEHSPFATMCSIIIWCLLQGAAYPVNGTQRSVKGRPTCNGNDLTLQERSCRRQVGWCNAASTKSCGTVFCTWDRISAFTTWKGSAYYRYCHAFFAKYVHLECGHKDLVFPCLLNLHSWVLRLAHLCGGVVYLWGRGENQRSCWRPKQG